MIRPATPADAAAVAAIWNHYIRHTTVTFAATEKAEAEVAALIATRPAFFVAETAGAVAGFSTYAQFGAAEEVALSDMKIELMFPADAEAEVLLRGLDG